jgi:hypothetical protein
MLLLRAVTPAISLFGNANRTGDIRASSGLMCLVHHPGGFSLGDRARGPVLFGMGAAVAAAWLT